HHIEALNRAGLEQIEPLALWNALDHIDEDDIGEFLIGNSQRAIRADISGAYHRDFLSQSKLLLEKGDLKNSIITTGLAIGALRNCEETETGLFRTRRNPARPRSRISV